MKVTLFVYPVVFSSKQEEIFSNPQSSAGCAKASTADNCFLNVYGLISEALFLLRLREPLDFYDTVSPGTASSQYQAVRKLPYVLRVQNIPP